MTRDRLPDLVIIGAAKCGTTSLAYYLSGHDQIYMSRPKELRYFSHEWTRGLDWYRGHFAGASEDCLLGEASPQYSQAPLYPNVPERMVSVIPGVKLIYMVRDPVDQMRSFFRHLVSEGREQERSFDEAIRTNNIYLAVASYGFQLKMFLEYYPPEQVLVVNSSDLLTNREATLSSILRFLGLEVGIPAEHTSSELNIGADKLILPTYLSGPRAVWRKASRITGKLPRRWRHSLRDALGRPAPPSTLELSSTSARWLRSKLEPDLHNLREYTGSTLEAAIQEWSNHLERLESAGSGS